MRGNNFCYGDLGLCIMTLMLSCRICGNAEKNIEHHAREMMFGTKEPFVYVECSRCGCLQIKDVPPDLGKYYPKAYYSLQKPGADKENFIRTFVRRKRAQYCLSGRGFLGKMFADRIGVPGYYEWLKKAGVSFGSKILDVGCGTGYLLTVLGREGFTDLTGIDPFIEKDILHENGIKVYKKSTQEVREAYDFILMDNSFEHLPDPLFVIQELHRLLKPGKTALLRVPVAGSWAWSVYGTDWVQMDPPRHLYLHTARSIGLLAEKAGFRLAETVYDSIDFQFWGSEMYKKGIALTDSRSPWIHPKNDALFPAEQMQQYREKSLELNRQGKGDQACFYLEKLPE